MNPDSPTGDWTGIACYLESTGGRLTPLSRELAAVAVRLARKSGTSVCAVTIETQGVPDYASALAGFDFDKILVYRSPSFAAYTANAYAGALIDALEYLRPSVVLVGASDAGKDIAPLAAARFKTGLTADCTGLEILPDGNLLQIRPAFGGNIMAEILTPETRPQFATVRMGAGAGDISPSGGESEIIFRCLSDSTARCSATTVLESRALRREPSITEARLIIVVGCGLKSEADIAAVRDLAESLDGATAATRGLVERGWMPPSAQVGLSGHSVSPELMVTLGVSGSVQFMAGIGGAGYIIAVNNDPAARIFSAAHLGLRCDLYEVLPELAKQLKRLSFLEFVRKMRA